MKLKDFLKVYLPFLFSFACGRAIMQTDLVMIARLGADAIAAFGIPMRIMILDVIVAFALAPVVSVWLASAKSESERRAKVLSSLQFAGGLAVVLTCLGFAVYPFLTRWVAPTSEIQALAHSAVFWLTLAIPSRLLQFTGSMILHGSGLGQYVVRITVFEWCANLVLNFLLIFVAGLGFKGSYIGTLICSWISLGLTLMMIIRKMRLEETSLKSWMLIDFQAIGALLPKVAAEAGRLLSERASAFLILWIFFHWTQDSGSITVFSVASEVILFCSAPFIAGMRASSVVLASYKERSIMDLVALLRPLFLVGLGWIAVSGIWIFVLGEWAGTAIYRLSGHALQWWRPFVLVFAIMLPIKWVDCILRSVFQAKQEFATLAKLDFCLQWFLLIPVVALGVLQSNPHLAWAGFLFCDLGSILTLACLIVYQERLSARASSSVRI